MREINDGELADLAHELEASPRVFTARQVHPAPAPVPARAPVAEEFTAPGHESHPKPAWAREMQIDLRSDPDGGDLADATNAALPVVGLPAGRVPRRLKQPSLTPGTVGLRSLASDQTIFGDRSNHDTVQAGVADSIHYGEPQWSIDNLARLGLADELLQLLEAEPLDSDAEWMSALERAIRTLVPEPVTQPVQEGVTFVSGRGYTAAIAILCAGVRGLAPGYLFIGEQLRRASSIELMLAVRAVLPR